MRCQTELGGHAAGSSRVARLDPLALPVRFTANDAVADERVRHVELHPERVILRRAIQGMRIALNVPVQAYLGVAIRLSPEQDGTPAGVAVYLEHRDPALSIELYAAENSDDVVAEWQLWSRVLGLPMLVTGSDGKFSTPFPSIGAVRCKPPTQRRRRRSPTLQAPPALSRPPPRRRDARSPDGASGARDHRAELDRVPMRAESALSRVKRNVA